MAKLTPLPKLLKKAQDKFNAHIRERDKDLGCISGATQNCIAPISEKTLGGKVGAFVHDMTIRQFYAMIGADFVMEPS